MVVETSTVPMLNDSVACSGNISVTTTVNIPAADSDEHYNRTCFKYFAVERQNHFRCEICLKHPDIVRRIGRHHKLPPVATESGTRFRSHILKEHCESAFHKECIKAEKIALLHKPTAALMPMDVLLAKSQRTEASRIGKLLIQVIIN